MPENSDSRNRTHIRPRRDIDLLLGSATRADMIWVYLQNPDKWLGPSEMARLTGRTLSDVQRNNTILWEIGLINPYVSSGSFKENSVTNALRRLPSEISRTLQANKVFKNTFRLDGTHPWVPALRMLLERSVGSLFLLQKALESLDGIEAAFVFGSFATSEQRPDSDIDLVVIGEHTLMTLAEPVSEIEKRVGREVQIIAYSPEEWRSKVESRSHFVVSLMESPKIFLVGDSSNLERITHSAKNEI
jgi:predicted nucleotidyltransferase